MADLLTSLPEPTVGSQRNDRCQSWTGIEGGLDQALVQRSSHYAPACLLRRKPQRVVEAWAKIAELVQAAVQVV
eukprot:886328-Pyramimonas_sp.AAC.1